jgi:hypothetical protein
MPLIIVNLMKKLTRHAYNWRVILHCKFCSYYFYSHKRQITTSFGLSLQPCFPFHEYCLTTKWPMSYLDDHYSLLLYKWISMMEFLYLLKQNIFSRQTAKNNHLNLIKELIFSNKIKYLIVANNFFSKIFFNSWILIDIEKLFFQGNFL